MRKRVVVLGSTGSIGTQTLDVIASHPDRFTVAGLAAGSNAAKLCEQAKKFGVKDLALFDAKGSGLPCSIPSGMPAILELVRKANVDLVVVAVAGVIGLLPTLEAINHGKAIALASKEVLVAAGELVMPMIRKNGIALTPIDSEHSAIFQCLHGYRNDQVSKLLLTASGGPFRGRSRESLSTVTPAEALNHPTWSMGGKITIDSATMMNKALEIIEARWLFDIPVNQIDVVIHPQSIVHSMVEFADGSVIGQMGWPDMRLPIFYALCYPERPGSGLRPWNPVETPALNFESPDANALRAINLARTAASIGGTAPCALNAANEEAANAFLRGDIAFPRITEVVEQVLAGHQPRPATLETILDVDIEARLAAKTIMQKTEL